MAIHTTDAIVLRKNDIRETSVLVVFYTRDFGKVRGLINRKIIDRGMIPKVKSCIKALKSGVKKVHIVNANLSHALLLEIFTDEGIGTEIVK